MAVYLFNFFYPKLIDITYIHMKTYERSDNPWQ